MRDDAELLDAWRGGEQAAGRELFDKYIGVVSRFFRNKVGAEAEDLIQRTFLACAEAKDRLRDGAAFRTYLLKVARSKLYKHYRAQRPQIDLDAMSVSITDLTASPSTIIARAEREAALLEALRTLPLDLQLVIELHYWEGMSTAELADVFEVPQGTIKTRLFRARTLVRERLGVERAAADGESDAFDEWAQSLRALVSGSRIAP